MPGRAGKSADGKGSPKRGYLLGGSKVPAGKGGAGAPPKTTGGMIRKPKMGKA